MICGSDSGKVKRIRRETERKRERARKVEWEAYAINGALRLKYINIHIIDNLWQSENDAQILCKNQIDFSWDSFN